MTGCVLCFYSVNSADYSSQVLHQCLTADWDPGFEFLRKKMPQNANGGVETLQGTLLGESLGHTEPRPAFSGVGPNEAGNSWLIFIPFN